MELKLNQAENGEDAVDIVVDGKFAIHLKRCDVGYAIECYSNNGNLFGGSEVSIWDEDIESEEEDV